MSSQMRVCDRDEVQPSAARWYVASSGSDVCICGRALLDDERACDWCAAAAPRRALPPPTPACLCGAGLTLDDPGLCPTCDRAAADLLGPRFAALRTGSRLRAPTLRWSHGPKGVAA